MSTKKQENDQVHIDNCDSIANKSRRKISKAGLGIPILLSLPGKTLWADGSCTYSGLLSGNISAHPGPRACAMGSGMSPGYWSNSNGVLHWPEAYPVGTAKFNSIFTSRHIKISTNNTIWNLPYPYLLEALNAHEHGVFALSSDTRTVAQVTGQDNDLKYQVWHGICALLNAASFPHFGYPADYTPAGVIADFESGFSSNLAKYVALEDVSS